MFGKIRSIFINNVFHFKCIDKMRQKVIANITTEKPQKEDVTILYYKAPFIKELEERDGNIFRKINAHFNNKAKIRLANNEEKYCSTLIFKTYFNMSNCKNFKIEVTSFYFNICE